MALESRRIERAIFLMPPRHGKTQLVSLWFPFWYLRRHPTHWVRLVSYGAEYASELGGKARDLVTEHGASFGMTLRKNASDHWSLALGGGLSTAGAGGVLTGLGADLLVIDDPIKNDEEARSKTIRDKQWDWLQATALTRLEPGGVVALVMTHWHYDDLAGRLTSGQMGGEPWHVLRLPAIATAQEPAWPDGLGRAASEALWPTRYSARTLGLRRAAMSAYWFSALYQQRPQQDEGTIFKRAWFRYFSQPDARTYRLYRPDGTSRDAPTVAGFKFATVDLAVSQRTQADYFVIGIWHALPNTRGPLYAYDLVLLDVVREHLEAPDQLSQLRLAHTRYGLSFLAIEKAGYQLALVQTARRAGLPARELVAKGDKVARAMSASPMLEQGQVYFPLSAPWGATFEQELIQFPSARHDDQVDVVSYAVALVAAMGSSENLEASGDEPGLPSVF
jgi:predicted phage terminase large subunit-like protein